jgi:hypothetical protein
MESIKYPYLIVEATSLKLPKGFLKTWVAPVLTGLISSALWTLIINLL